MTSLLVVYVDRCYVLKNCEESLEQNIMCRVNACQLDACLQCVREMRVIWREIINLLQGENHELKVNLDSHWMTLV